MRKGMVQDTAASPRKKSKLLLALIMVVAALALPLVGETLYNLFDQWKPQLGIGPSRGVRTPIMDAVNDTLSHGFSSTTSSFTNSMNGLLSNPAIAIPFLLLLGGACMLLMRRGST